MEKKTNKENQLLVIANLKGYRDTNDNVIKGAKKAMDEDFLTRLAWDAERMYKAMLKNHELNDIIESIENMTEEEDVKTYLSRLIDMYTDKLTKGRIVSTSTSMMHNLCSLWGSEVAQEMLNKLEWTLRIL